MRLNSLVLSFVAAATFALAGCAADASDPAPETTDSTQQGNIAENQVHNAVSTKDQASLGGMAGPAIADQKDSRMYDFNAVPRIGDRSQYEVNLTLLNNASVVPHSGQAEGRDIALGAESGLGTTTGQ
jgi:opacity protein-like surface antigen